MSSKPVCATCNDTHAMTIHTGSGDERAVMCTRCPLPCDHCRQRWNGPFCATTPCPCRCHEAIKPWSERVCAEHGIKGWCFKCQKAAFAPKYPKLDSRLETTEQIRAWVEDDDVCHHPVAREVMRRLLELVDAHEGEGGEPHG